MPAHPVSRLVRFTLAVGANVIFDHLGYRRRPTVHPVRVIEAVELVACPVFTIAEQTRQRLTFGDVERYLAQLAAHPPIMAAFAQLERDSMIERTRAGLAAAAANGRKGGGVVRIQVVADIGVDETDRTGQGRRAAPRQRPRWPGSNAAPLGCERNTSARRRPPRHSTAIQLSSSRRRAARASPGCRQARAPHQGPSPSTAAATARLGRGRARTAAARQRQSREVPADPATWRRRLRRRRTSRCSAACAPLPNG